MLDLIIKTSSDENSIVLDCFCGSGTTLLASQMNNRKWIGIDQSELAIQITKERIDKIENDLFIQKKEYDFLNLEIETNNIDYHEKEYLLVNAL
jgi:adenine-specific DNA-methyltransferase